VESSIYVLDHCAHVRLVLCHKLEYLSVLRLEGPVPKLFNLPLFYLINRQELLIVLLMRFEEAGFAD